MSQNYEHILALFRGVRPAAGRTNSWYAFCPYHKGGQERRRSLSIWITSKGNLWIKCFRCGTTHNKDIFACLGIPMKDLFADSHEQGSRHQEYVKPKLIETTVYHDEIGTPLFRSLRFEPKSFAQEMWDDKDHKWRPGIQNTRRVLLGLPRLLTFPKGEYLFIGEGERVVAKLQSWGLHATCNPGGTGMGWREDYTLWLKKHLRTPRCIIVLPDNDEPGYRHADQIVGSLQRHNLGSQHLLLPDLPEKGDLLDWCKKGNGKPEFLTLLENKRKT